MLMPVLMGTTAERRHGSLARRACGLPAPSSWRCRRTCAGRVRRCLPMTPTTRASGYCAALLMRLLMRGYQRASAPAALGTPTAATGRAATQTARATTTQPPDCRGDGPGGRRLALGRGSGRSMMMWRPRTGCRRHVAAPRRGAAAFATAIGSMMRTVPRKRGMRAAGVPRAGVADARSAVRLACRGRRRSGRILSGRRTGVRPAVGEVEVETASKVVRCGRRGTRVHRTRVGVARRWHTARRRLGCVAAPPKPPTGSMAGCRLGPPAASREPGAARQPWTATAVHHHSSSTALRRASGKGPSVAVTCRPATPTAGQAGRRPHGAMCGQRMGRRLPRRKMATALEAPPQHPG